MILVHNTQVLPSLPILQYIFVYVFMCVYRYRVLDFESSPKLWPFKTVSVTTYTVALSLVFGGGGRRGIQVAYALHVKL